MARIRTIKPELFTDSKLIQLNPVTRYVFIGLLTQCDRRGRFKWDEIELQLRILPRDEEIVKYLDELIKSKRIIRYGQNLEFCYVPKFEEHQYINPKELESVLPAPPGYVEVKRTYPETQKSDAYLTREDASLRKEGRNVNNKEGKNKQEWKKDIDEKSTWYKDLVVDLAKHDYWSTRVIHQIVTTEFVPYWMEKGQTQKKAKWEKEVSFDPALRIRNWIKLGHERKKDWKCSASDTWHQKGEKCHHNEVSVKNEGIVMDHETKRLASKLAELKGVK